MTLAVFLVSMVTVVTSTNAACLCNQTSCCGDLCRKVLILLVFMLTVCCAINSNKTTEIQDECSAISPKEAYFLEGQDLVLTCDTESIMADNLTFVRGRYNEEVPQEYIHKLNDTAIKLIIPKITSENITSIKDSIPYRCANRYTKECYDNIHVQMEYYPREPRDLDCRIYDFNEMTCTWSLGVEYHRLQDINIDCETQNFMYKVDDPTATWAPCPHKNATSCHWNTQDFLQPWMMRTRVTVTAIKTNVTKETIKTFYGHDVMVPGPVKDLRVNRSLGERCVELDWEPTDKFNSFKFIVTYSSPCTKVKTRNIIYVAGESMRFNDSRIFCGLTPYTDYTYTVKGRLMIEKERDNKTLIEKGYWSDGETITVRTKSDVLDVNAKTSDGLYEMLGSDSINLYWTPLEDCDLHDDPSNVFYKIKANKKKVAVKHPQFLAQIDVPKSKKVNVTLQAVNSFGPAPFSTSVTVFPTADGPSPSELIIQYNQTEEACMTIAEIVVKDNQSHFQDMLHTLVWCEGTQHICQELPKWVKLGTNVTSFVLPGTLCEVDYRYGLVTHGNSKVEGQIVNTGIIWERCTYQLGKEIDKPLENVHLTEVQPANGFSVAWKQYNCDEMKAYITHYIVTYCVDDWSGDCTCSERAVSVNVSRERTSYTASDLSPGSQVCVLVRGITKTGRGPANTNLLVHTIFAKSDRLNVVMIVVVVVFSVVFLGAGLACLGYKKYQKWRQENSRIVIHNPDEAEIPLQPGPIDIIEPNDANRKYSVSDIIGALEGNYIQPNGINSYLLAGQSSGATNIAETAEVENAHSEHLLGVSDIDDATYKDRSDKIKDENEHCRDSISSLLSDADHGHTSLSIEDLLSHSDHIVPEKNFCKQTTQSNKVSKKARDSKEVDDAVAPKDGTDSFENVNEKIDDILHGLNRIKHQEKNNYQNPVSSLENLVKTDESETVSSKACDNDLDDHIGDMKANGIKDHSVVNRNDNEQGNSDFDESSPLLNNHYKKVSDIDDEEDMSDDSNSNLSINRNEKLENDGVDTASAEGQKMNNFDGDKTSDDVHGHNDEAGDFFDFYRDVECAKGNITNKMDEEAHVSKTKADDVEQSECVMTDRNGPYNSDALKSGDSKTSPNSHRTSSSGNSSTEPQQSNSSDNSGTVQSYMTADNGTFKVPKLDSSDTGISSNNEKDVDKHKICNQNGKLNGIEKIYMSNVEQEVK